MTESKYTELNPSVDARSSASLVPMLVAGLVMIVVGMLAVIAFV